MKIQRLNSATGSPEMMRFAERFLFRVHLPFVTFLKTGSKLLDMKFVAFLFVVLTFSIPGVAQHLVKDGYLVDSNGDTAKVPVEHYVYYNGNLIFSKIPYYFGCPCDSVRRYIYTNYVYDSSTLIAKTYSDGSIIENFKYTYYADSNGKRKLSSVISHSYSMTNYDRPGEWASFYEKEVYHYENERVIKKVIYRVDSISQHSSIIRTYKYDEQNRIRWEIINFELWGPDSKAPDGVLTDTVEYVYFRGGNVKKILLHGESIQTDSFFVDLKSRVVKESRDNEGSPFHSNFVKVHNYEGDRLVSTFITCDNALLKNNKLKIVYKYKEVW